MVDPVEFFDEQFRRQVDEAAFHLNPFEQAALDHMRGRVLDLGCGLGNLALEAARRGCEVVAIDASPTAVDRIVRAAGIERLPVQAMQADIESYAIEGCYDTIVAIGLLMFFPKERSLGLLEDIKAHVSPGGRVIVNVMVEGTSYMRMFQPGKYYLFGCGEPERCFTGWTILLSRLDSFDAPGGTTKEFATVIAEKTATGD